MKQARGIIYIAKQATYFSGFSAHLTRLWISCKRSLEATVVKSTLGAAAIVIYVIGFIFEL